MLRGPVLSFRTHESTFIVPIHMCLGLPNRLNPCGGTHFQTARRVRHTLRASRTYRTARPTHALPASFTASEAHRVLHTTVRSSLSRRGWRPRTPPGLEHNAQTACGAFPESHTPPHTTTYVQTMNVRVAAAHQPQPWRSATAGRAPDAQRDGGPAHKPPLGHHRRPQRPALAAASTHGPQRPHLSCPPPP